MSTTDEQREHDVCIAIIDLANLAYQHGREELSPWSAQWHMLEERIAALAQQAPTPAVSEPAAPVGKA